MKEKYRKEMDWWFAEFAAESEVEHNLELFPELNGRLSKFAIGIYLWNANRKIDINKPDDANRVRLILKILDQTPGFNFFDNVFNKCSPDIVCEIIGMSPMCPQEEPDITFDYYIIPIKPTKMPKNILMRYRGASSYPKNHSMIMPPMEVDSIFVVMAIGETLLVFPV